MHYPSSILQDRGWEDPARHLSHVIFHFDPKLLDVRVQVEVSVLHLWRVKDIHHISYFCHEAFTVNLPLQLTSLLISSCLSGAERAVALIIVEV